MSDRRSQHQHQIATDHQNGDPERHQMHHRKGNESRGEQEFIRQGVQHLSKPRPLVGDASNGAVKRIRQPGDEESRQRIIELFIVEQPHIDGN